MMSWSNICGSLKSNILEFSDGITTPRKFKLFKFVFLQKRDKQVRQIIIIIISDVISFNDADSLLTPI